MLSPWSKPLHLLPNLLPLCAPPVFGFFFSPHSNQSDPLKIISLLQFFQWFSITFRGKCKNSYYDFGNCSDFISYHLPSPSSVQATAASSLFSEHTKHGPAFPFGLLPPWNFSLPRYSHGFLITSSSLLKCQLIVGTVLTILSVIGTLFPMSCPPSVPILHLPLSSIVLITTWHFILFFSPSEGKLHEDKNSVVFISSPCRIACGTQCLCTIRSYSYA